MYQEGKKSVFGAPTDLRGKANMYSSQAEILKRIQSSVRTTGAGVVTPAITYRLVATFTAHDNNSYQVYSWCNCSWRQRLAKSTYLLLRSGGYIIIFRIPYLSL